MSPSVTKCKVDSTQGGERTQGTQGGMLIFDFNTFCNFEPKTQGLQHRMLISGSSDLNIFVMQCQTKNVLPILLAAQYTFSTKRAAEND